jgi:hypothetical protein
MKCAAHFAKASERGSSTLRHFDTPSALSDRSVLTRNSHHAPRNPLAKSQELKTFIKQHHNQIITTFVIVNLEYYLWILHSI